MGILKIINPASEELFGAVDETTPQELEQFVLSSKKDISWRSKTLAQRIEFMQKIVALLEQQKEEIAFTMAKEMGKPLKAGRHEIEITKKRIEAFCRLIPEFISDEVLFEDEKEKNIVRFEPKGTVAVISPWNAPIFVPFASIIPALLCGNNVLFKPSEYVPFTGIKIYRLFEQLQKEGFPKAAFQSILGGKEIGKYLVESDVDFVALTGSVRAGKEIMMGSAEKLHSFVLELGGKDPAIVLEDADITLAAREIVKNATLYTGQVCFGVERVYCAERIFDLFVQQCIEEMKKIVVGNPLDENTDIGPFAVKFQMEKVLEHIRDALEKGASLVYGGQRLGHKGYFMSPGVLINVTHNMRIMKEETFGPLLPVMPFTTIDEAIRLANDSDYGLTASIWTSDIKKGEEIAYHIEAGTVEINRHGMSKAGMPWGGYKMSGIGRIYSKEGVRAFTNVKHVWIVKY